MKKRVTRAITVDAPAETIWPWLVRMGPGRGGAYTYDWIENVLGLKMHRADEILPEYQGLKVGDVTPLGKRGPRMRVDVLDADSALVMRSEDGAWVWAFGLYPQRRGTRLVSRNRITDPEESAAAKAFSMFIMEPGSLARDQPAGRRHRPPHDRGRRTRLPPTRHPHQTRRPPPGCVNQAEAPVGAGFRDGLRTPAGTAGQSVSVKRVP